MANYQRYQTLSSAEQYLYCPDCPVWVNRYQISWDNQTGARLLQCRMVNVSQKTVTAVYLRVHCRDGQGQDVTTLHLVPITGLHVAPGEIFGDDKVVTLWPNRTSFAELYPERVCFGDGTAWNEQASNEYTAIPAPTLVHLQDRAYPALAKCAAEGGVRNEFYFRTYKNLWSCTCGVPNSNQMLYCRHCGADRSWLEQHMDAAVILAPPPPEPAPKEPDPEPEPMPAPPPPQIAASLEKFDLASYLSNEPIRQPAAEQEFPVIHPVKQPEEKKEEKQPEKKKVRPGRIVAIVLAALLLLGAGGWIAYRELAGPYLQYQQGVALQNAAMDAVVAAVDAAEDSDAMLHYVAAIEGYEKAIAVYETLAASPESQEYTESLERIKECRQQIALTHMRMGDYQAAYAEFVALGDYAGSRDYAADCLCSLGVLAYNGGDYNGAWDYVEQLRQNYPDYDRQRDLHDYTAYKLGEQQLDSYRLASAFEEQMTDLENAKRWFIEAGSYSDSVSMVTECDYLIAGVNQLYGRQTGDENYFVLAAEQFGQLESYTGKSDGVSAALRRQDCMLDYCDQVLDPHDETFARYLTELYQAGNEAALDCMFRCCEQAEDPTERWVDEYLSLLVAEDYPGALELQATLLGDGSEVALTVTLIEDEKGTEITDETATLTLDALDKLSLAYRFDSPAQKLALEYTLCGQSESDVRASKTLVLNEKEAGEGRESLKALVDDAAAWPTEPGLVLLKLLDADGNLLKTFKLTVAANDAGPDTGT